MSTLTHFIVVRRDLDLGTCLAMVAHAAGESFHAFAVVRMAQAIVGDVLPVDVTQTVVIVKGARNEGRLRKLAAQLDEVREPHVVITETDGVYAGQVMAIGIDPVSAAGGRLAYVRGVLNDFQLLTALEGPRTAAGAGDAGCGSPMVAGEQPASGSTL